MALLVLTILCSFYHNVPKSIPVPSGATDNKFTPDTFFAYCSEGFSWGRTNNDGYNDSINYENGMSLNILLMGSSHMEALQVMRNDNTASVLAKLSDRTIYNIGRSSHYFATCSVNLEAASKKYTPSEYIIIETRDVNLSNEELESIINKNISKQPISLSYNSGILYLLRKITFLRLVHSQFKHIFSIEKAPENNMYMSDKLLTEVLESVVKVSVE